MATSPQELQNALKWAEKNPKAPASIELQKRIEAGRYNDQLSQLGVNTNKFTPQAQTNIGIGFDAPNQFTGEESFLEGAGKAVRNAPRSGFELVKNIASAVTSPIETGKTIFGAVRGGGEKAGRFLLNKTPLGNIRGESGETLRETAQRVPQSEDEQITTQINTFINERYGSLDSFKETVVEDPVGAIADIAGLVSGAGAGLRGAGLTKAAGVTGKVASAIDPVANVGRAVKPITTGVRNATGVAKSALADVIPTLDNLTNKNIAQALDLTQGDVRNFRQQTGGTNVGDYLLQKQVNGQPLIAKTVEETLDNVDTLKGNSYRQVREEVSKIDRVYDSTNVPRVREALSKVVDDLDGVIGLEAEFSEASRLINKENYTLSDIQRVKEIIDERFQIYKKSGDAKSGTTAQGLDTVRQDLRKLIEDEVSDATDGAVNIAELNNDVRFSYAIEEAIEKGLTKDLTRNEFGITDIIIGSALGLGAASGNVSIPTALGLFGAKRIISSPSFKLSFAKGIQGLRESDKVRILSELKSGNVSQASIRTLKQIVEDTKQQAVIINPALSDIERATDTQ